MCVDMYTVLCAAMHVDMCVDVCADMHADMFADTRRAMTDAFLRTYLYPCLLVCHSCAQIATHIHVHAKTINCPATIVGHNYLGYTHIGHNYIGVHHRRP